MPLLLDTAVIAVVVPDVTFTFVVPGDQRWTLRSILAVASRQAGGIPNRAYTLTVTNGTDTVAAVAAQDAGTEPGLCTVTFANVPAAAVASGSTGVVVAPLGPLALPAGYTITGTITNPAAGDSWLTAVCWHDFVYTNLRP